MSIAGTIFGHVRIVGVLGHGGMRDVDVGVDERLQRRVALQAIRAERRRDDGGAVMD